jgi:hypothetical protein
VRPATTQLRRSHVKFIDDISGYTNYCHLAECTNTKQCALSSRSVLLQSLQNTKLHRHFHVIYKHSKCVRFWDTLYKEIGMSGGQSGTGTFFLRVYCL